MTFPLRGRDGVFRPFLTRAVALKGDGDEVLHWFGTNTDISEQRFAQRALEEADRKKDEFLAILAHELRNPLAPIRTAVEVLQRQTPGATVTARMHDIISRQTGHLSRLVDDLMDVSRITLGKIELRREMVEARQLVLEAVEECRSQIDAERHALNVRIDEGLPRIWVDPTRWVQVMANLLGNAAKYTPPHGRIDLNVFEREAQLEFVVHDTGIGIEIGRLDRLFELFAQAEPAQEQSHGGLGIGLALVRGLVRLHGGEVRALSDGPGKGSTFVVSLPIQEEAVLRPPVSVSEFPSSATPKAKILVVDDNVDAVTTLSGLLQAAGHDVEMSYNGSSALTQASEATPQIVLLDVGLPDINGFEVARRMRSMLGSQVRIALVTGWGQPSDVSKGKEAGADMHFVKPVSGAILLSWIGQTIESLTRL